jgi:hypothetical protein
MNTHNSICDNKIDVFLIITDVNRIDKDYIKIITWYILYRGTKLINQNRN